MKHLNHYYLIADARGPRNSRIITANILLPKESEILSVFNAQFGLDNTFSISVLESKHFSKEEYTFTILPTHNTNQVGIHDNCIFLGTMQSLDNKYYDIFYEIIR